MLLWLPGDSFYSRQMSQKNVGSPDPEKASRLEVQTGVTRQVWSSLNTERPQASFCGLRTLSAFSIGALE